MTGTCVKPIADDAFLAWWTGELAAPERRRLEAHLLACDDCAARLRLAGAVADGVRALVRQGRVPTVLTVGALERLRREGRKVREYRVAPGGGVHCTVAPEDDVLVARLELPPGGDARVDLVSRLSFGSGRGPGRHFVDNRSQGDGYGQAEEPHRGGGTDDGIPLREAVRLDVARQASTST